MASGNTHAPVWKDLKAKTVNYVSSSSWWTFRSEPPAEARWECGKKLEAQGNPLRSRGLQPVLREAVPLQAAEHESESPAWRTGYRALLCPSEERLWNERSRRVGPLHLETRTDVSFLGGGCFSCLSGSWKFVRMSVLNDRDCPIL